MQLKNRFICFVGIDGSGKSTLVNKLEHDLVTNGYNYKTVWLRMNYLFTKPILLFCRIVGLTKRPLINGKRISVHEFYRSPFIAALVRILHTFDTFIYFLIKVYIPLKFTNRVIICDRFIYDIFIDFSIESRNPYVVRGKLFKIAERMLNNSCVFLIHADKNLIFKRRPDVTDFDPEYESRYKMYEDLRSNKKLITIENNDSLEQSYNQIRDVLFR